MNGPLGLGRNRLVWLRSSFSLRWRYGLLNLWILCIQEIFDKSYVVSAITAVGIVGPLITTFDVNPVLMVLATAAGSNTITHVNDATFWLFKEYFNLSIKDTFKTWGLLLLSLIM